MVKISQKLVEHVISLSYMNPSDVELRSLAYLVNSAAGKEFEDDDRLIERLVKYIPLEALKGDRSEPQAVTKAVKEAFECLNENLRSKRAKLLLMLLLMELE